MSLFKRPMKTLLAALLITLSAPVGADERLATATTLLVADWAQTRYIARSDEFHEINPVLGRNPSTGDVDRYFGAAIAGTWILSEVLPDPWRDRFLTGVVVLEIGVVGRNATLGIGFDF